MQLIVIFATFFTFGQIHAGFGINYQQVYHHSYRQQIQILSLLENSGRALEFRAKLCPDIPPDMLPLYRFHLISRKCYEVGSRGPCGSNMIFVKQPLTWAVGKCICRPPLDKLTDAYRPMIHHFETNDCYYVYKQGYCSLTEWLVLDNDERPRCVPNLCLDIATVSENEVEFREFVWLNGTCAEIGEVSDFCDDGQIVSFMLNGQPGCVNVAHFDNTIS